MSGTCADAGEAAASIRASGTAAAAAGRIALKSLLRPPYRRRLGGLRVGAAAFFGSNRT
jgi:hypothetical protein